MSHNVSPTMEDIQEINLLDVASEAIGANVALEYPQELNPLDALNGAIEAILPLK
jgi:hypothetical protein